MVLRLSYMVWDAVFLCFDVTEKMGLLRMLSWAYQKWQHAVDQGFCTNSTPLIYLLGLKKDLRMECSFEDHRLAMETGLTVGSPSCCVNPRDTYPAWTSAKPHLATSGNFNGVYKLRSSKSLVKNKCPLNRHAQPRESLINIIKLSRLVLQQQGCKLTSDGDHRTEMITSAALMAGIVAIAVVCGALVSLLVYFLRSWSLVILIILTGFVGICICVTTRHIQLTQSRRSRVWPSQPHPGGPSPPRLSEDYYLFVLGSGGHTKEMLMMMDDGTRDFAGTHRRYLISSGDDMSQNHLEDYETELKASSAAPGTYDTRIVTRARRVHQPLWSTPWTGLMSFLDIFPVLLLPPSADGGRKPKPRHYPGIIFSNGPATGFFVALAVHTLKMLGLVPEDRMRFVYIESWARISTLSLTGKLLFYTGLADAFYVQHEEVAGRYGLVNAREMVFNARRIE
ncbi:hypothetical protein E4U43_006012 [Claviceps pusilla]|uniref:UDP-N-acetylglucosamine transferase subunit ALG14 n=1 Tax=Claviceps pusilla TaxID=123648 RepID=A0A9P7NF18_9HYPO|nr:hypothetical protein E4U43_006012 [Claviceps pusilla]